MCRTCDYSLSTCSDCARKQAKSHKNKKKAERRKNNYRYNRHPHKLPTPLDARHERLQITYKGYIQKLNQLRFTIRMHEYEYHKLKERTQRAEWNLEIYKMQLAAIENIKLDEKNQAKYNVQSILNRCLSYRLEGEIKEAQRETYIHGDFIEMYQGCEKELQKVQVLMDTTNWDPITPCASTDKHCLDTCRFYHTRAEIRDYKTKRAMTRYMLSVHIPDKKCRELILVLDYNG